MNERFWVEEVEVLGVWSLWKLKKTIYQKKYAFLEEKGKMLFVENWKWNNMGERDSIHHVSYRLHNCFSVSLYYSSLLALFYFFSLLTNTAFSTASIINASGYSKVLPLKSYSLSNFPKKHLKSPFACCSIFRLVDNIKK